MRFERDDIVKQGSDQPSTQTGGWCVNVERPGLDWCAEKSMSETRRGRVRLLLPPTESDESAACTARTGTLAQRQ
jgi:hypothetical protein